MVRRTVFRRRIRRGNRSAAGNVCIFIFLFLLGAFMLLPLVYSCLNAFKPLEEVYIYPPRFFVRNPTLENFSVFFKLASGLHVPFIRYLFNSLFVTILTTVVHIVLSSMAAYPLAKYRLRLSGLFSLVVVSMLFTSAVLWLPNYILMAKMHFLNTYLPYIVPNLAAPIGLFLMKQFMEQIPFALVESATIDGAGHWTIFWRIVMPQVKPAWMTLAVFSFLSVWNQASSGFVYDERLKLLGDLIANINAGGFSRLNISMAGTLFMIVPPILLFLFTQNRVLETMAYAGIKE